MFRLVLSSLAYHTRIHAAVALGVIAATAVLTGALLVGDSMRGSLRHLTLDRLGRIDEILLVDRFFRDELADELAAAPSFRESGYDEVVPAIVLPSCSVETRRDDKPQRAANVTLIAADERFWKLGAAGTSELSVGEDEIILNEPLAAELHARLGDLMTVRLPTADQVPADSPLGKKDDRTTSVTELRLVKIIPAEGLGRFSLRPNQSSPRNAYVRPAKFQAALDQPDRMNAMLVAGESVDQPLDDAAHRKLEQALSPKLADYGLKVERHKLEWQGEIIYDYFQITSDRMLLEFDVIVAARKSLAEYSLQEMFTYLATRMERVSNDPAEQAKQQKHPIPYSTIAAVDSNTKLGPCLDAQGKVIGPPKQDEIILTSWAAEDRGAKVGDEIKISYFEPETTHGEEKEVSKTFKLIGIVPLTEPAEPFTRRKGPVFDDRPTIANDPDLTPEVKGLTDKASMSDWNAPFDMDASLIRSNDDSYWENHRTTPKAYLSLQEGRNLWTSRWGNTTSIRIPASSDATAEEIERRLADALAATPTKLGFQFQAIKLRDLAASSGTTPFDVLFLALSFFVMISALLLVLLLFRLGVERRASEIGVLLGFGWTRGRVARWLLLEGLIVSAIAAIVGVLAGIGYAWLMLVGLRTWWLGAIATPFLTLYITPRSLAIGYFTGVLVSLLAIYWGVRQTKSIAVRRLLAGQMQDEGAAVIGGFRSWVAIVAVVLLLAAIGCAALATTLGAEAQAGAFLGSGALVLIAVLLFAREQLRSGGAMVSLLASPALPRLAVRSAARNPARSVMTLALVAAASFLIVALSAFRMDPTKSGSGGLDLIGQSSQPIYRNLESPSDRQELLADDAKFLDAGHLFAFRLQAGDDASCRNLYQPSQPQVLGVPHLFVEYYDDPAHTPFAWAGSGPLPPRQNNPWHLLEEEIDTPEVPVVLDQATAMYSLKLYGGVGERFEVTYPNNQKVKFRVVGLLSNSVLQGSLLVSENAFRYLFSETAGYRFFMISAPPGKEEELASALENRLSDQGFDVQRASDILADLLAVQNTYLSTFQALGALGLLLGTFGVAAVQLRSILERRGELGLLRAQGFTNQRLARLVMLENVVLLIGGLAVGVIAALIAVLPHMLLGGARPPVLSLAGMLAVVAVVGSVVGLIAVRSVLKSQIIASLRGE